MTAIQISNESALGVYRFSWTTGDGVRCEIQWGEGVPLPLAFFGDRLPAEVRNPERFGWKKPCKAGDFKEFVRHFAEALEADDLDS